MEVRVQEHFGNAGVVRKVKVGALGAGRYPITFSQAMP